MKFVKLDCQKELRQAMSYNRFATLGNSQEKEEVKNIVPSYITLL